MSETSPDVSVSRYFHEVIVGKSRQLAFVPRYGSSPVVRSENVAEHTYYVMYICAHIYEDLCRRHASARQDLDLGLLMIKGLMHDTDEMHTGDIPRPFKYYNEATRRHLEAASHKIFSDYADNVRMPDNLYTAWRDAKKGPEGLIVKVADMLQCISYLHEEITRGNSRMLEKLPELTGYLNGLDRYLSTAESDPESDPPIRRTASGLRIWISMAVEFLTTRSNWVYTWQES